MELTHAPPLGKSLAQALLRKQIVDLLPGATLVAYSDGLVERRDAHLDGRLALLREVVQAHTDPTLLSDPQQVPDAVLDMLVPDPADAQDHVALMVVPRRDADPDRSALMAEPGSVSVSRRDRRDRRVRCGALRCAGCGGRGRWGRQGGTTVAQ